MSGHRGKRSREGPEDRANAALDLTTWRAPCQGRGRDGSQVVKDRGGARKWGKRRFFPVTLLA